MRFKKLRKSEKSFVLVALFIIAFTMCENFIWNRYNMEMDFGYDKLYGEQRKHDDETTKSSDKDDLDKLPNKVETTKGQQTNDNDNSFKGYIDDKSINLENGLDRNGKDKGVVIQHKDKRGDADDRNISYANRGGLLPVEYDDKIVGENKTDISQNVGKIKLPYISTPKRRRLDFVHIPKTAGTALELAALGMNISWGYFHFGSLSREENLPPDNFREKILSNAKVNNVKSFTHAPWHVPIQLVKDFTYSSGSPYEDSDIFVVVRDPYEKLLCEYYYRIVRYILLHR